jgi:hypothetical protein
MLAEMALYGILGDRPNTRDLQGYLGISEFLRKM